MFTCAYCCLQSTDDVPLKYVLQVMVKVNSIVEGGRELHSFQGTSFYGNIQVEEVKPKRIKILLITCTIWSKFKSFIFLKGLHFTVIYK